ncbi:YqzL family protein [Sediminibacillus dalangtanensis]|uniref:YqzL family protein n=1 Tax=Sediminibacillus dalangtanensis TaxID=2729421 RepID=A0ABX7VSE4_9BACI|nr:YqzL family protein [Sediminibacillus dalangtanensis]QTM99861.1 YqzL family protein [Sediminibacillus dalangtanensis]
MLDFPWKIFSQTGNIETYLLMKEMESYYDEESSVNPNYKEQLQELDRNL